MSRVLIRVDAVKVSGSGRAGRAALPGRLEAAVARALGRTPTTPARGDVDVPVVRVRVGPKVTVDADDLGAAVADAIGSAVRGRGADR